jgi:hypothetical protein
MRLNSTNVWGLHACNILGVAFILGLAISARAVEIADVPDDADAVAPKGDVIRLFDGKSLGDCYTWLKDTQRKDPRKVFSVVDGNLHISGDGLGALVTNKRYRDYHAVVEFKWGEKTWHDRVNRARDSGFLIHGNGRDGGYDGTWMPSLEVQIIEGGVGDFVPVPGVDEHGKLIPLSYTCNTGRDRNGEVVWKEDGPRETFKPHGYKRVNWFGRDPDWKDEKNVRGSQDKDSPHGEWTRIDVICDGGHVVNYVNGTKVNEAFDVTPHAGHLQLQTELAEVDYRRWELWPLDKAPKPELAKQ